MMKEFKAKSAFMLYRGAGFCLRPFMPFYLHSRIAKGKEDKSRRKERFGHASKNRPEGPLVWLHAASVGETMALMPLIEHILSLRITVLLTTGTVTAASLVENRFGNRIVHQYHPLDIQTAVSRFLDYWKPDLALVCESEIWPVRIAELAKRRIPQILVNAHLSERSYKSWKNRPALAHFIFSKFDMAIGQNQSDAENYRQLGVRVTAVSGNLKADIVPLENTEVLMQYRNAIGSRPVWAAISTHEGEEYIAAEVHCALKNHLPDLMTVIVPRHPERADGIYEKLRQRGLQVVRKSQNGFPNQTTDILLGDTIGEMGLYLRLAKVAFIGKSLGDKGGHNPLEPALVGTAMISGPYVENFQETYETLKEADAVRFVEDATQLAVQVNTLLTQDATREEMIKNARDSAIRMSGALQRSLALLQPFIQPLLLQARLDVETGNGGQ